MAKAGRSLDPHEGMLVTPAKTYFAVRERLMFEATIPQALNLYKATNGKFPQSHDEFMAQIIQAGQIQLPQLPEGQRYVWDPDKEELGWVCAARSSKLRRPAPPRRRPLPLVRPPASRPLPPRAGGGREQVLSARTQPPVSRFPPLPPRAAGRQVLLARTQPPCPASRPLPPRAAGAQVLLARTSPRDPLPAPGRLVRQDASLVSENAAPRVPPPAPSPPHAAGSDGRLRAIRHRQGAEVVLNRPARLRMGWRSSPRVRRQSKTVEPLNNSATRETNRCKSDP